MSAEIIPFPVRASSSGRFIAEEYSRLHDKAASGKSVPEGRDKAAYAKRVIEGNIESMKRLGVSSDRIAAEIREIEAMFARLDEIKQQQEHQSAAVSA
jgi:hypothetical protein